MSSHHQNSGNVFGILEAIRDQFKVEKLLLTLVMGCKVFTTTSAPLTQVILKTNEEQIVVLSDKQITLNC